jgi:ArsR family transcriptional regulator
MNTLAQTFKALSEETRIEIAALLLWRGELCVCDIVGSLGITQSKASRHLRYMLNAGLVANRRVGVWMHYRIPEQLPAPQRKLVAMLRELLDSDDYEPLRAKLEQHVDCCRGAPPSRAEGSRRGETEDMP